MESDWAAEHLQIIRTLMERTAIYRRALAPMMLLTGMIGLAAAGLGLGLRIQSPGPFIIYWMVVSLAALGGSFLLVRRQALRDAEVFWSPPTRRVTQAMLPALVAGLIAGIAVLLHIAPGHTGEAAEPKIANVVGMLWLPCGWIVLYGCAIHAAGFFMPRGMKLLGWLFILGGCGMFALGIPDLPRHIYAHGIMGFFFGALHLAYGIYLYFTEKRKNEA